MQQPYNYYEILQLPQNNAGTLKSEDVKAAYHRALLRYHPDKLLASTGLTGTSENTSNVQGYSIDEIVSAYQTLLDHDKRVAYNNSLKYTSIDSAVEGANKSAHEGVESFDLGELLYDERLGRWHKQCRCGNEHGYVVTEDELEKEMSHGEIYIGCNGCSLFIRVLFEAADERESKSEPTNASSTFHSKTASISLGGDKRTSS